MKFNNELLIELCGYILPEDPTLAKEVQQSIKDPQSFLSQIQYVLKDWIKEESIEEAIPWYTLIHGLYQRGLAFELTARSLAERMKTIPYQTTTREDQQSFMNLVETFLTLTGDYFYSINYVLGELRLPSGVTIVTMLHQQTANKCADLVLRSGYGKLTLYPSQPSIHQMDHLLVKNSICSRHAKPRSLPV